VLIRENTIVFWAGGADESSIAEAVQYCRDNSLTNADAAVKRSEDAVYVILKKDVEWP
jgi:cellobiose-specific phosphotransferase system component IIA